MVTTLLGAVAVPELELVQLLRPDGTRVPDDRYPVSLGSDELVALYDAMVVTRALDQELINLPRRSAWQPRSTTATGCSRSIGRWARGSGEASTRVASPSCGGARG